MSECVWGGGEGGRWKVVGLTGEGRKAYEVAVEAMMLAAKVGNFILRDGLMWEVVPVGFEGFLVCLCVLGRGWMC